MRVGVEGAFGKVIGDRHCHCAFAVVESPRGFFEMVMEIEKSYL